MLKEAGCGADSFVVKEAGVDVKAGVGADVVVSETEGCIDERFENRLTAEKEHDSLSVEVVVVEEIGVGGEEMLNVEPRESWVAAGVLVDRDGVSEMGAGDRRKNLGLVIPSSVFINLFAAFREEKLL